MLEYVLLIQLLGVEMGYDRLEFKKLYPQDACYDAGKKLVAAFPEGTQAAYWCIPDNEQLSKLRHKPGTK